MYRRSFKALADFTVALLLLIPVGLVILIICFGYFISQEFPVFFLQERIGINGTTFKMLKFRTLGPPNELKKQRTFPLGSFLRLTNLDELPQIVNVLRLQMSWVGPRPLPVAYGALMSKRQFARHSVKPGITGWTQVHARHQIPWNKKFELDLYYVQHISLLLDLEILYRTIAILLSSPKDVSLEEEPFVGDPKV